MKKEDMAKTLENLNTGIVVKEETIRINPMIMFVRVMLILQIESEPEPYFTYGLTINTRSYSTFQRQNIHAES